MRSSQILPRGKAGDPWLPRRDTTVLLLTAAPELQGEVGRVSAAAAVELLIGQSLEQLPVQWDDVAAVLVDAAVDVGLAGWRGPTAVVGFAQDAAQMWRQAVRLGADRVAILPDSAQWLADYLACLGSPTPGAGVVGIVGGCGGAGASTLSVLVAAEAAARGTRTLLVDGDRWGGGLSAGMSVQDHPGLRWPELLGVSGSINPAQLAAALPQVGTLSFLSWDSRGRPDMGAATAAKAATAGSSVTAAHQSRMPPTAGHQEAPQGQSAVAEVMRAARGAFGLVLVDVGRTPEAFRTFGVHCSGLLVVVPARPRAAAAALAMMESLPPMPVAVVVRGPVAEGLDAAMVADAMGLPLVGEFPHLRGAAAAVDPQRLPELLRRRRVRMLAASALEWMAGDIPFAGRPRGKVRP
ncbi:septum site-determining protein Ssd [Arthrobacter sp. HLT1-20]